MRVWVTRDEPKDGPMTKALRAAGLTPVQEPVLERHVVDDAADAIARLDPDDWLVLTSVYAIEAVPAQLARVPHVAVVGEPSRRAASERGFRVDLVSSRKDGASLFEELRRRITSGKVCYPRSSLVEPPQSWASVELISPVLYETIPRVFDKTIVDRVDVVCVASPSAVHAIGRLDLPFASIGPSTSAALRAIGVDPWVEPVERSFEGLARAIAAQASDSRHHRA